MSKTWEYNHIQTYADLTVGDTLNITNHKGCWASAGLGDKGIEAPESHGTGVIEYIVNSTNLELPQNGIHYTCIAVRIGGRLYGYSYKSGFDYTIVKKAIELFVLFTKSKKLKLDFNMF